MPKAIRKAITTQKPRIVPDPILDLISEARRRINEFDLAGDATRRLRQKIGEHHCGPAVVFGPEYFAYVSFGTEFHSVGQINRGQKFAEIRLREKIMGIQKELKRKSIRDVERVKYLAMIARDKLALHQIKETADWLKAEWHRRDVRSGRLRARSGYDRAAMRRIGASAAATEAVRAIGKTKPRTVEGATALIGFIADHCNEGGVSDWIGYELGGVNAALDSASEALERQQRKAA